MKILHIIPSYKPAYVYAGVIESVSSLCEALVREGHSVDVFTTTANGKTELKIRPGVPVLVDGVRVIYFKRITKDPTHASPSLWIHLWRNVHHYEVIHIHSWWNVLVIASAWICILRGRKAIISPRGMLTDYIFKSTRLRTKKWIHRLLGRRALAENIFHATAASEYNECTKLIKGWKGFILPNILSLSTVKITRTANDSFTLLFLSRIHPKKGLDLLLDALARIPFKFCLKIGGTGDMDYVNHLKARAEKLGIASKVEWMGWLNKEEKFRVLMRSDCFILTSHNENFANVIVESLHVGTPVIISEEVGLAPFVRDTNLGWITSLNPGSIHEAISRAYEDVVRREFINKSAPAIIRKYFNPAVLVAQYIHNYNCMSEKLR